jgi:hypothetical protein
MIRFAWLTHRSMLTFSGATLEAGTTSCRRVSRSDVGYDDAWKQLPESSDRFPSRPLGWRRPLSSLILIGTMIVLNLVTGVIITSLEGARMPLPEESRSKIVAWKGSPAPGPVLQRSSEQLRALAHSTVRG